MRYQAVRIFRALPELEQVAVLKVCLLKTSLPCPGLEGREEDGKLMARLEEARRESRRTDLILYMVEVVASDYN